ncbi:glutamate synthase [NADH] [Ceratobasidium sp. UAMH 11750]|nr:glutamate synthase [NADH] [Ceratobasidium sp. UAMH 11750]
MSLEAYVGPEGNLLGMKPEQCHHIVLKSPVLGIEEINALKDLSAAYPNWSSHTIDITFPKSEGPPSTMPPLVMFATRRLGLSRMDKRLLSPRKSVPGSH